MERRVGRNLEGVMAATKIVTYPLPETNSQFAPEKEDGWKTILSFWDGPISGANC